LNITSPCSSTSISRKQFGSKSFGSKGHGSYHGKGTLHHRGGGIASIRGQECHLEKWESDENTSRDQIIYYSFIKVEY
jgi:hypothetical protein